MGMVRADHGQACRTGVPDSPEVIFGIDQVAINARPVVPRRHRLKDLLAVANQKPATLVRPLLAGVGPQIDEHLTRDAHGRRRSGRLSLHAFHVPQTNLRKAAS